MHVVGLQSKLASFQFSATYCQHLQLSCTNGRVVDDEHAVN